jgi:hypothetical protein
MTGYPLWFKRPTPEQQAAFNRAIQPVKHAELAVKHAELPVKHAELAETSGNTLPKGQGLGKPGQPAS